MTQYPILRNTLLWGPWSLKFHQLWSRWPWLNVVGCHSCFEHTRPPILDLFNNSLIWVLCSEFSQHANLTLKISSNSPLLLAAIFFQLSFQSPAFEQILSDEDDTSCLFPPDAISDPRPLWMMPISHWDISSWYPDNLKSGYQAPGICPCAHKITSFYFLLGQMLKQETGEVANGITNGLHVKWLCKFWAQKQWVCKIGGRLK